ncbi:Uu.00g068000.m01.CDS01 [Anthostomella pinea]|uniref:Uu.00g068000.m01.CDS01 n=1 Tax=Anthostomella pinea TaxID=933095 RepID=A0AAI8VV36_9PEZI|nr:Uu.00g068000.m01.CDS01 [Anthostomella pinea]
MSENEEEDIPLLSNIAPSIFVPATFDYTTAPPPLPTDPRKRLEQRLVQIEEHEAKVQRNIRAMTKREVRRIHLIGETDRPYFDNLGRRVTKKRKPGLTTYEQDLLPNNREELARLWESKAWGRLPPPPPPPPPPVRGGPWEVPLGLSKNDLLNGPVHADNLSPRAASVKFFLNIIQFSAQNLEGHADAIRAEMEKTIAQYGFPASDFLPDKHVPGVPAPIPIPTGPASSVGSQRGSISDRHGGGHAGGPGRGTYDTGGRGDSYRRFSGGSGYDSIRRGNDYGRGPSRGGYDDGGRGRGYGSGPAYGSGPGRAGYNDGERTDSYGSRNPSGPGGQRSAHSNGDDGRWTVRYRPDGSVVPHVQCGYCKKVGHFEEECWHKKDQQNGKPRPFVPRGRGSSHHYGDRRSSYGDRMDLD